MKIETCCIECDTTFTLKYKGSEPALYCPFCGSEIILEESNEYEEPDV